MVLLVACAEAREAQSARRKSLAECMVDGRLMSE